MGFKTDEVIYAVKTRQIAQLAGALAVATPDDLNQVGKAGATPLIVAVMTGAFYYVEALVKAG